MKLQTIGARFIKNRKRSFLSLKLNLNLNLFVKRKTKKKKGINIPICLAKKINGYLM
jgi:hypothetical protein